MADYNNLSSKVPSISETIKVSPDELFSFSAVVTLHMNEIVKLYKAIGDAMAVPASNWMGRSKKEAEDFNGELQTKSQALFGRDEQDSSGAATRLCAVAAKAGQNFGWTEDGIKAEWDKLTNSLTDQSGGNNGAGNGARNFNDGPVTENNPPK